MLGAFFNEFNKSQDLHCCHHHCSSASMSHTKSFWFVNVFGAHINSSSCFSLFSSKQQGTNAGIVFVLKTEVSKGEVMMSIVTEERENPHDII